MKGACEFYLFLSFLFIYHSYKPNLLSKPHFPTNIFKKFLHQQQPEKDTPEGCENIEEESGVQPDSFSSWTH